MRETPILLALRSAMLLMEHFAPVEIAQPRGALALNRLYLAGRGSRVGEGHTKRCFDISAYDLISPVAFNIRLPQPSNPTLGKTDSDVYFAGS